MEPLLVADKAAQTCNQRETRPASKPPCC